MSHPAGAARLLGAVVGRYRLVQLLGSGGTGDVYLAEAPTGHPRPAGGSRPSPQPWSFTMGGDPPPRAIATGGDRPSPPPQAWSRVAIKVLRAELRDSPDIVRRFRREAEAGASVRHPNVRAVLQAPVEREGVLCFVMELLVGLDLADTLAYSRTLGSPRAVGIAAGAAAGLAAAHAAGVIHRDVKPENIFLVHAADGREAVKLLDFGFAYMPGDDISIPDLTVLGTPEYMAPEQARGALADPAADVYSLGVVLYEMLAGRPPFAGSFPSIAHAEVPPIRATHPGAVLSPELEAVVARALEKDPARRFASMDELHRALLATPEGTGRGL